MSQRDSHGQKTNENHVPRYSLTNEVSSPSLLGRKCENKTSESAKGEADDSKGAFLLLAFVFCEMTHDALFVHVV